MSGRNQKKSSRNAGKSWYESAWLSGLLLVALALYMGLSLSGPVGPWWRVLAGESPSDLIPNANPGGPVGAALNVVLHGIFGGEPQAVFPGGILCTINQIQHTISIDYREFN